MRNILSLSVVAFMLASSAAFAQDTSGGAGTSGDQSTSGGATTTESTPAPEATAPVEAVPDGVQSGVEPGVVAPATSNAGATTLYVLGGLAAAGLIIWAVSGSGHNGPPVSP